MATKRLVYNGSLDGSSPIYQKILVNDTQTIYKGDVVVLSSGKATLANDAAAVKTVLGVSNTDIVTTTATSADVIEYDANPMSVYKIPIIGAGTPTIGTKYDLGTRAYELDTADTIGGYLQIVGEYDGSAYDSTNGTARIVIRHRVFAGDDA